MITQLDVSAYPHLKDKSDCKKIFNKYNKLATEVMEQDGPVMTTEDLAKQLAKRMQQSGR